MPKKATQPKTGLSMAAGGSSWRFGSAVLEPIREYLLLKRRQFLKEGRRPSVPSRNHLKVMVECAFWASLCPDEGRYPKFSMVFARKDECPSGLEFGTPRAFLAKQVAALAPSLSRDNSRIGITRSPRRTDLCIWGVTQDYPFGCVEVHVIRPGRVMILANGERLALIDRENSYSLVTQRGDGMLQGSVLFKLAEMLGRSVGSPLSPLRWKVLGTMLLQITEKMHAHGHGGAVVVVPEGDVSWGKSISFAHPLRRFGGLRRHLERLIQEAENSRDAPQDIQDYYTGQHSRMDRGLVRVVESVGALTAVDGATVLNDSLDVLGFGAKIMVKPQRGWRKPVVRSVRDMLRGEEWGLNKHVREFADLGGTRHQSAAFLVAKHACVAAIVASQDGGLTIFTSTANLRRVVVTGGAEMLLE